MDNQRQRIANSKDSLITILNGIVDDPSISLEKKTKTIIHGTGLACAIVAVQPIPFADLFVLTPIQVVMVIYLSKAMGNPLEGDKAKEIITYIISVVGWGVLAQQVVLGLYKTVLPFLGAITTMPLVYAATIGLGYSAKTVLEARQNDKKISNEEIKKIAKVYAKNARQEKKIIGLASLKNELNELKQQGLAFEQYKDTINQRKADINELELTNKHLQNQVKSLAQELNKRIPEDEVDEILVILEKEAIQNTDLKQKIVTLGSEIESNKLKISRLSNKRMNDLITRFTTVYSNINISEHVYKEINKLETRRFHQFEKQIGLLQYSPEKANFRDKVQGTNVREVGFDRDGRIYITNEGNKITIQKIGNKSTQLKDIDWLKLKGI